MCHLGHREVDLIIVGKEHEVLRQLLVEPRHVRQVGLSISGSSGDNHNGRTARKCTGQNVYSQVVQIKDISKNTTLIKVKLTGYNQARKPKLQ